MKSSRFSADGAAFICFDGRSVSIACSRYPLGTMSRDSAAGEEHFRSTSSPAGELSFGSTGLLGESVDGSEDLSLREKES